VIHSNINNLYFNGSNHKYCAQCAQEWLLYWGQTGSPALSIHSPLKELS